MGYFIKGYEQGIRVQNDECSAEEYGENVKKLISSATYGECVEWYNGFYKGMLDVELKHLEQAFTKLKKDGERENNNG